MTDHPTVGPWTLMNVHRHLEHPTQATPGAIHSNATRPTTVVCHGPSYLDPGSGGPDNDFTNRNTTFMTWNLIHLAKMLKDANGIPAHGNQRSAWDVGSRFDFSNPEYR